MMGTVESKKNNSDGQIPVVFHADVDCVNRLKFIGCVRLLSLLEILTRVLKSHIILQAYKKFIEFESVRAKSFKLNSVQRSKLF